MASRNRWNALDDANFDDFENEIRRRPERRKRHKHRDDERKRARTEQRQRERRKVAISKPFKCKRCKAFIGTPPSGGSQRNHCPNCLYSLHVDGKTPGDRRSDCGSLMAPAGTFFRRNGEQVVVHHCLGCGTERHNRIAADDSPLLLMRLSLLAPPIQTDTADEERPSESA